MNRCYKDADGVLYDEGDIVYNPCFGDIWLVERYTEEEKQKYETECEYCLSQYGDKELYFMDIDEPDGFKIICKKNDSLYEKYIKKIREIAEELRKEYDE